MGNPIREVSDLVGSIGKSVDDNVESGEERQKELTKRLEIDMGSDNKLSKMIRPITLIFLMVMEAVIVVAASLGVSIDIAITSQVGLLLGSAIGFYFESKRRERIADKNATANLKIEKMKVRAEIRRERKQKR